MNKIFNEDNIKTMERLKGGAVDCIVTSPPYNLGGDFHTFADGKRVTYGDYKGFMDNVEEKNYQLLQLILLNECHRILKDDGFMFYNHKNRLVKGTVISPLEWINKSNFNVSQIIVINLKSTANVDKRRFFPVHELLYVLNKDKDAKLNNHLCLTDVWEMKKVPRRVSGHPATFHIDLPTRCILASTKEGDLVYDPYAGTGTTGEAAFINNRKYLLSEISEEYYNLSLNRLQNIEQQISIYDT